MTINNKHLVALTVDGEPWCYLDNVEIEERGSVLYTVIDDDGIAHKQALTGPFLISIRGIATAAGDADINGR